MKKFNFSKLLFAAALVASIAMFSGCKPEPDVEYVQYSIQGEWISQYNEKYSISYNDFDNYYYDENNGKHELAFSTTDIVIKEVSSSKGFIYGKFDDAEHVGYGASVGQWYALYYDELTKSSVNFYMPFKEGGKAGCNSLEEAISEYTVENEYFDFSSPSECTKSN